MTAAAHTIEHVVSLAPPDASTCRILSFNVVQTAASYSNLAAFLAGFAVTSIVVVVAPRVTSQGPNTRLPPPLGDALKVLLSAMISLTITALDYAVVAGEAPKPSGRAVVEEVLAGAAFALATFLLLFAISLLLDATDAYGVSSNSEREWPVYWTESVASRFVRSVLARYPTLLLVLFLLLGFEDYEEVHLQSHNGFSNYDLAALSLITIQGLYNVFGYSRLRKGRRRWPRRSRVISWIALAIAFFLVALTGLFSSFERNACRSPQIGWAASSFVAVVAGAVFLTTYLALTSPLDGEASR